MINDGSHADELWPDNWTAVTRDGRRSAQFEHMLLVTETGVEILTARQGTDRTRMVWDDAASARPGVGPAPGPAAPGLAPGPTPGPAADTHAAVGGAASSASGESASASGVATS